MSNGQTQNKQLLISFAEERPANHSAWQDLEKDWLTRVEASCSPSVQLLADIAPAGWSGRTSPASCHLTVAGILAPSSGCWRNSGMGSPTAFLTLNASESAHTLEPCPSAGGASSLSDILEDAGSVPQRYFLSAKACGGILRRADKRARQLPPSLRAALEHVAQTITKGRPDTW